MRNNDYDYNTYINYKTLAHKLLDVIRAYYPKNYHLYKSKKTHLESKLLSTE